MSEERTVRVRIAGRVQGVSYRYWTRETAEALGLSGWVRNLPDGRGEVVAEGSDDVLGELESRLRAGPSFATVAAVDRAPVPARGDAGFHIR